jgi:hypothetical protein
MENDFEARIREMQLEMEEQAKVRKMSFEQAVALVRANESKIRAGERELLEAKIAELSARPEISKVQGGRKSRGSSKYLFRALKVLFPLATTAVLGVPIPSPFGSGRTVTNLLGGTEDDGEYGDLSYTYNGPPPEYCE